MNYVSELLQKTGYCLCKLCLSAINEMDMLRSVDSPFDFLFKCFLNPSVRIRPWQRQQKCVLRLEVKPQTYLGHHKDIVKTTKTKMNI